MSIENVTRQLVDQIVRLIHPKQIILFGSAARKGEKVVNDIDLLVVMPEGTHKRHTAQDLYRKIIGIEMPFDIIVATPGDLARHRDNPGLIYWNILREGIEVYAA
ncbi:MAG: nucleotidyltransferase domain-containing protein [Anaerolineales bacterium]|nr:nucleotidyltransferase domain-containing protein [Anaerolineales bacterium]